MYKNDYCKYLKGYKGDTFVILQKNYGISYPGELLERYHEKMDLMNDKLVIFESLLEASNMINRNDVQDNQLELFLDSIKEDDLNTRLSKNVIRMNFYNYHNETEKSNQAFLKLIGETIEINTTIETLEFAKLLNFVSDEKLKYDLLSKADNLLLKLTTEKDLEVIHWTNFEYIPKLYTKEKALQNKLKPDLVKFLRLICDMQEKVIKEDNISKLSEYGLDPIECYYLNYISLNNYIINYENKKEKAATLFILESFNSDNQISNQQYSIVKELYNKHNSYTRKIDGCESMKGYLQQNLHGFKNINNYPVALSLIDELFDCFLNIEINNNILNNISNKYFDNIVKNKFESAKSKDEVYTIINVFNKRYNISFVEDVLLEDKHHFYLANFIIEKLMLMDIFDYKKIDYNAEEKRNDIARDITCIIRDFDKPIHFEIFFYLMDNYGIKVLKDTIDERSILKVFEENITSLSPVELQKFYDIVEEILFYKVAENNFIKFIYNVFKSDNNFSIKSKPEWKSIMYRLIDCKYLNSYQIEYVRETFLTKEDIEKIKKDELEKAEKQKIENLIANINKADSTNRLYDAVYYPSDIKSNFDKMKHIIFNKIKQFIEKGIDKQSNTYLYNLLVYMYSFDGISKDEFIDHLDLVKGV